MPAVIEERLMPRWPYRLPHGSGGDGVVRTRENVLERLLHVGPSPVRVRSWRTREGYVHLRAESIDPLLVEHPIAVSGEPTPAETPAAREAELAIAIERMRFSLAVEDDMGEFFRTFRRDPLIGPTIHHKPWVRPRRRPWPWEALCWAITKQLIETSRAAEIQRRIVRRWAPSYLPADHRPSRRGPWPLRDVPSAAVIAGRAPAELASMDLSQGRSEAMVRCAREVARERAPLDDPDCDARLLAISGIGPWTIQCLGLAGRGEPDSLPAGDLAYVKLVGHLAGLGRRATVEEVEEYFAPYAPFRGLAGTYALVGWHKAMGAGPPARLAA
ncbi:MAG: DNA-3-methyladenine glycosylase family protein [Solirubrobacterales bacterium]